MGWTFHRIWSTDWFHRRQQESQRLAQALDEARAAGQARVPGANDGGGQAKPENLPSEPKTPGGNGNRNPITPSEGGSSPSAPESNNDLSLPAITAPQVYHKAGVSVATTSEPHEATLEHLVELVRGIVGVEGPMHTKLVARRIAEAFGKSRVGGRIADITWTALTAARRKANGDLLVDRGFWLTRDQSEQVPVRDRSAAGAEVAKAAMLPSMEIVAAADLIQRECGQVEREDLIREVSRLFGFRQTGSNLARVIGDALDGAR